MIKVFNTLSEYNTYISGGLVSGDLYYVVEDGSTHFRTNNVNGIDSVHNMIDEDSLEEGSFVANGEYEPVEGNGFSSVTVNVPASAVVSGTESISENGSNIDVTEYATVDVNVPIPSGYIQPSGNLEITENGEGIDVAQYATVDVNVAAPTPQYTELNLNTLTVGSDGKSFSTLISATVGQTIEIYNPNHLLFGVGHGQPGINPSTGEQDGYYILQNGISSYDLYNDNYLEHLYVSNAPNTSDGSYSTRGFCISYYSAAGTPVDGVIYYRVF